MSTTIKERLKSKAVWLAVLAQVVLIIAMFNPDIATEVKAIATAIIEIVTLFGFLNNPTDSTSF